MTDSLRKAVKNHIQNLGILSSYLEEALGVRVTEACTRGDDDEVYVTLLRVDDRSSEQAVLAAATSLGALLLVDEEGLHLGLRAPLWSESGEDGVSIEAHSREVYATLAERVHGGEENPPVH